MTGSTSAADIAAGYAFTGPVLHLGVPLRGGECPPGAPVRIPLPVLNRHGPAAGATGTGRTGTLQLVTEQLLAQGVPVLLADVKGDQSGVPAPGTADDRVRGRAAEVGRKWTTTGFPAESCALGGLGHGIPPRATATGCAHRSPGWARWATRFSTGSCGSLRSTSGMHRLWTEDPRPRSGRPVPSARGSAARSPVRSSARPGGGGGSAPAARSALPWVPGLLRFRFLHLRFRCAARGLRAQQGAQDRIRVCGHDCFPHLFHAWACSPDGPA